MSLSGENRRPISAGRCDQLNALTGVIAAGGIVSRDAVRVATRPNESVELIRGTAGLAAILWPGVQLDQSEGVDFVSGSRNAETYGLDNGVYLALSDGNDWAMTEPVLVSQVADPSTRKRSLDSAFFEAVPPDGSIVECLVEASPGARKKVEAILVGWFPPESGTSVSPYFQLIDPGSTAEQKLQNRITQHLPWAALLVIVTAVIGIWHSRRQDFALYRSLGLRNTQFLFFLVLESALLVLIPVSLGLFIALFFMEGEIGSLAVRLSLLDGLRLVFLLPLIPLVSYPLLIRSISLDTLRGR
jgi:hypothetical protein